MGETSQTPPTPIQHERNGSRNFEDIFIRSRSLLPSGKKNHGLLENGPWKWNFPNKHFHSVQGSSSSPCLMTPESMFEKPITRQCGWRPWRPCPALQLGGRNGTIEGPPARRTLRTWKSGWRCTESYRWMRVNIPNNLWENHYSHTKSTGKWWFHGILWELPSGKHTKNHGQSPCFMGKLTISTAIFSSYVANYRRVSNHWEYGKPGTEV